MSMTQGRIRWGIHSLVLALVLAAGLPVGLVHAEPAKAKAVATASVAEKVNINTATAETLAAGLKGIGPAKAEAIVAYRAQFGAFESAEELLEVKGVGPALLEQNRDRIVLK